MVVDIEDIADEDVTNTASKGNSSVSNGADQRCSNNGNGWNGVEVMLRRDLLAWYAAQRRRLPWRGDPPPWCVDKAALRRSAAAEADERRQPRLARYFSKKLQPPSNIDLTENDRPVAVKAEGHVAVAGASGEHNAERAFTPSPYGTWVSEVMLQQTQVERVVDYWTKWMRLFPTINALAQANADDVNAAWAGLGFYGRARRLHEGAKYVVAEFNSEVPSEVQRLRRVPGVGPYTAGAIASIAFGRRAPIVDGNVVRVLSRLLALPGDASSTSLVQRCWALAEELVDSADPGGFNQAIMELGATVCTPQAPACDRCAIRRYCLAVKRQDNGDGSVVDFPAKAAKKPPKKVVLAVAVLENDEGRVLLVRRPPKGLLAGQWEFPSVEVDDDGAAEKTPSEHEATHQVALSSLLREEFATALLGATSEPPALRVAEVPRVEHVFSHQRHTMHLYRGCIHGSGHDPSVAENKGEQLERAVSWMSEAEARDAGITSGVGRIFVAIGLGVRTAGANDHGRRLPPTKRSKCARH
eukprot:TRINITY_DN34717_c0_g1_i1.p1 TRINITY_DN34717_c0_g1~~TRINITY_DN34717_c0_g1_i1.p1  ORF type:complete len:527 (-),score=94.40 TRINITY_DN34717_c0_g1_i1:45-1625(-)